MKLIKTALVLTLLVLASMISFSNRCKPICDGKKMIVMSAQKCSAVQAPTSPEREAAGTSPLLRIAVTL